ncbi:MULTISPECIES: hypothetical protein [Vibrio]|uniref:hypothetical protein n=1 Tax=Vibrio TaxID=662 RepID=UPI00265AC6DF|nr:hypothetical protein [Vibrio antiquarius]MCR9846383.1 hypothetical protein [Vibrio antiquarius]MCR9911980.1 hypothetical protein [Vibrio antiquarius]
MSKQLSFAMVGVILSLGVFSTEVMADPKHRHGHRYDHHHEHHHHHKRKHKHKHKHKHKYKHRDVIYVESRRPRRSYYYHDRIPRNSTYIKIGDFTYLKVDDRFYRRSNDRYIHVEFN